MSLYYEIHITLNPDFDRVDELKRLAWDHSYHMADLVLMKGQRETWQGDMFITGRQDTLEASIDSVLDTVAALKAHGFQPIRYKIEDTVIDSRRDDRLQLLAWPPPSPGAKPILWGFAGYTSLGALIDNEADMDD